VTGRPGTACPSLLHMTSYASLTYSTDLQRYVGLGNTYTYIDGRQVCGFYMQLSSDMVTGAGKSWSPRRYCRGARRTPAHRACWSRWR